MRILILYASEHGQTRAISEAIGARLERAGHHVELVDSASRLPTPAAYDVVLIGSRIQFEQAAQRIRTYIEDHHAALASRPTGCFTVSMAATSTSGRAGAEAYLERMLRRAGWRPRWLAVFGGALPYRRYDVITRWVMKRIAALKHQPVDTSRNHDLTSWDAVAALAETIATELAVIEPPVPASDPDAPRHRA